MGSQEGALGRTEDLCLPERSEGVAASTRRPNSINLPRRSRAQILGGKCGTAKTSAEGPPDLVSVHPGSQPSIDPDLEMEKL
eukprot:5506759-Pyramimonas_sp.AAC.1